MSNTNTNSFLPRASPQTTPKNLKVTNVSDTSFSISFVTDSPTVGYIKYGSNSNALNTTVNDDRDQSSGSTGLYRTHHITVRSLKPSSPYYFKIGTGSRELYDDNGSPYTVSTVSPITSQAKTIYGEVTTASGGAATGALIYINGDDLAPLSTFVQSSGSFVVSLSQARTKSLQGIALLKSDTVLSLLVVSPLDATTTLVSTTMANAQPIPQVWLGIQNQDFTKTTQVSPEPLASVTPQIAPPQIQSKFTSSLLSPPTEIQINSKLHILYPTTDGDLVTLAAPQIKGTAPPQTRVTLKLTGKSTQSSTVSSDSSGTWVWTPTTKLTNGEQVLTATAMLEGVKESITRSFRVDLSQAGIIPTFTASGSGVLLPTPAIASVSAATPTPTITSQISHPSTSSGTPVSGNSSPTILLILSGLFVMFVATGLWVLQQD